MTIKEEIEYDGKKYLLEYSDSDDFSNLERSKCRQVYGICYVDDTIVVVFEGHKKHWGLPGGAPEEGENLEDAIKREVLE